MRQHPAIRLHLLLLAATFLLASTSRGQDFLADPNLPAPKHWAGTDSAGDSPAIPAAYPTRTAIDDTLTRARVLCETSRDFATARALLDELWLQVNYYSGFDAEYGRFEGKFTLYTKNLDDVLRARVELLETIGQLAQAAALARYPYFHVGDPLAADAELGGFGEPATRAILTRASAPWWEAKRESLALRLDQEPSARIPGLTDAQSDYVTEHFGRTSPELAARVLDAIETSDLAMISTLGLRATPALAAMVLADFDGTSTSSNLDPLFALATVDAPGACRLAVDHFSDAGQSFRLRTLSLLESIRPFARSDVWDYSAPTQVDNRISYTPPRCRVPFWIDLIATLASDARTRQRVLGLVDQIAERDALNHALQVALIDAVQTSDERDTLTLLASIDSGAPLASAQSILEAALAHQSGAVRRVAANALADYADAPALVQAVQDPDVQVRRAVARSFTVRNVPTAAYAYPSRGPTMSSQLVEPPVTPARAKALSQLLVDADAEVRRLAAKSLARLDWEFADAAPYLAAADHEDASVTSFLLTANFPNEEARRTVFERLGASRSRDLLASIDSHLAYSADWRLQPERWAGLLRQRMLDAKMPFLSTIRQDPRHQQDAAELTDNLFRSKLDRSVVGARAGMEIAIALQDPSLLEAAMDDADREKLAGPNDADFVLATLELLLSAEGHVRATEVSPLVHAVTWSAPSEARLLELVRDRQYPLRDRTHVMNFAASLGLRGVEDAAFTVIQEEGPFGTEEGYQLFSAALAPLRDRGDARAAQLFERSFELVDAQPWVPLALALPSCLEHPEGARFAAAALDPRLSSAMEELERASHSMMASMFRAYALLAEDGEWSEQDQELMVAGLRSECSAVYLAAAGTAQRQLDPSMVPLLGTLFRETTNGAKQSTLVSLLASLMTREAGEELVQCIGAARSPEIRGNIQNQLTQIRNYLEEAAYWAGQEEKRATEQTAIQELVAMLEEEDPLLRAAALDGLASFQAREHLPKVIRLLQDPDARVQRAARNAIRILQGGISSLDEGDE